MADFTAKKAKVMDRRRRRSERRLVVSNWKWRLKKVKAVCNAYVRAKSQLQYVRSVLHINSRTPMGNLLMMEKLLDAFLESEQEAWPMRPLYFLCRVKFDATTRQTLAMLRFKQISLLLMRRLVGKILLIVLI